MARRPVRARLSLAVLFWMTALSMAASPGRAHVVAFEPYEPMAGPVLAGDRVLWASQRPLGGFYRRGSDELHLGSVYGGPSQVLQVLPNTPFGPFYEVQLAASGDRLAAEVSFPSEDFVSAAQLSFSGPVGSRLSALAQPLCGSGYVLPYRSIGVSGQSVAYPGPGCGQAAVSDFAHPQTPSLRLPDGAFFLRLAGRYVAYWRGRHPTASKAAPIRSSSVTWCRSVSFTA